MNTSKRIISSIIISLAFSTMFAQNIVGERRSFFGNPLVDVDGLRFEIVDGSAIVNGIEAPDSCVKIDIPSSIEYRSERFIVTKIASSAFSGCYYLDSITVPESVTEIGHGAFSDCPRLSYIRIQNSAALLDNFHPKINSPYLPCENGIQYADRIAVGWDRTAGKSYVIKEGTASIASHAFQNLDCDYMHIPASVKIIGDYAFESSLLSGIALPDSLIRIGDGAFAGCANLKSIRIPKSVTEIGYNILDDCPALELIEVVPDNPRYDSRNNCNAVIESAANRLILGCSKTVVPESVVEIADYAFYGCNGMKKIHLPVSVAKIGPNAFENSNVGTIEINRKNPFLECRNNAVIKKDSAKIVFAVTNAKRLPAGVKIIGENAYQYNNGLKNVTIPGSVVSIGCYAFADCQNLKAVRMSDNIVELPDELFSDCLNLQSVRLSSSIKSIPSRFFADCPELRKVEISEQVQSIGQYAFSGTSISKIKLPDSLRFISHGLLYDCVKLESVIMPESLDSICSKAFARCKSLGCITIPEGTQTIGHQAFWGAGMESVSIPESVTQIGDLAFSYCDKLKSVEIRGQIDCMGADVFKNDFNLQTIRLCGNIPPHIEYSDAGNDHKPLFENCTLLVPPQCIEQYRESPFWGKFKNITVM